MSNFTTESYPPRLTPSPVLDVSYETSIDLSKEIPIPPLRRSIFPHPHGPTWHVNVVQYNHEWPSQYEKIAKHLNHLFKTSSPQAQFLTIEHIGSTAIPGLAAKPNIDVVVTFPSTAELNKAVEALNWEIPDSPPFVRYTQCPDGGNIPGRESFKIYLPEDHSFYATTPERSVYLIVDNEGNHAGKVQIRGYRTVREVLKQPSNQDLFNEYAKHKLELRKQVFTNCLEYSASKDAVIRKILIRGGWSEEEVNEKEAMSRREFIDRDLDLY